MLELLLLFKSYTDNKIVYIETRFNHNDSNSHTYLYGKIKYDKIYKLLILARLFYSVHRFSHKIQGKKHTIQCNSEPSESDVYGKYKATIL